MIFIDKEIHNDSYYSPINRGSTDRNIWQISENTLRPIDLDLSNFCCLISVLTTRWQ